MEYCSFGNILSYVNKPLHGAEIKMWIEFNTRNETEYSNIARSMLRYMNLTDNTVYKIVLAPPGTGAGEQKRYRPNVIRVCDMKKITHCPNSGIACPECGAGLECMCVIGADESLSGKTERLYNCYGCGSAWSVTEGEEVQRYFFG